MQSRSYVTKPKRDLPTASGESIGRPGPWREGRYERAGEPGEESVIRKPGEGPADTVSTPVTREDYEGPGRRPARTKPGKHT